MRSLSFTANVLLLSSSLLLPSCSAAPLASPEPSIFDKLENAWNFLAPLKQTYADYKLALGSPDDNMDELHEPDWMSRQPSDLPITSLTIPGTHDTMSYKAAMGPIAQTQSHNLTVQLEAGIRYIDIRVRHLGNRFQVVHNIIPTGHTFATVVEGMGAFLNDHPQEAIIMRLKDESYAHAKDLLKPGEAPASPPSGKPKDQTTNGPQAVPLLEGGGPVKADLVIPIKPKVSKSKRMNKRGLELSDFGPREIDESINEQEKAADTDDAIDNTIDDDDIALEKRWEANSRTLIQTFDWYINSNSRTRRIMTARMFKPKYVKDPAGNEVPEIPKLKDLRGKFLVLTEFSGARKDHGIPWWSPDQFDVEDDWLVAKPEEMERKWKSISDHLDLTHATKADKNGKRKLFFTHLSGNSPHVWARIVALGDMKGKSGEGMNARTMNKISKWLLKDEEHPGGIVITDFAGQGLIRSIISLNSRKERERISWWRRWCTKAMDLLKKFVPWN